LIVGGGFAGSYVARKLGRRGATIVSPENFILFTGMLPEAASCTLEPRHVVVPLRIPLLSRKLRVVTDWTVALFFRRDIAELGVLEQPRRLDG
jgi:NADH:ubiquinone reductase (H+-translocating)